MKVLQGILLIVNILLCNLLQAQKKELTNDHYFKSNFKGITQPLPSGFIWIDDSHFTYSKESKKYVYDCKTNIETLYVEPEIKKGSIAVKPSIVNKSNNLYNSKNVADEQLTFDEAKEINPTLSPDGKYVAYTKNNNLYTINIETKKETQLTTDGSDVILNGYASWVYYEEILGRQSRYKSFWWSPDSKTIAYFRSDDTNVPIFMITDAPGQHGVVETTRYPKAGDKNPTIKIGFVNAAGGATVWGDFNEKDDQYFGQPNWTTDGKSLWVNWMSRAQNNLIVYEVTPATGAKKQVYTEQQKTWIDLDDNDRISFLQNGKGFLLLSDKTGWKHIYYHDITGKLINAVTQGNFTVLSIDKIDEVKQMIYFVARSKENSATRDYYSVKMNGKNLTRLTFGNYNHQFNASPNSSYCITYYNNTGSPTQIALVNAKGKIVKELATAKGAEFDQYNLAKTEIIRVKSDDGKYDLPMKITWPINFDKNKKYPVIVDVYGGPDAGTVWNTWTLTGTQQWYAKEGIIQVAMDHRASGHFGKEGVALMHRNLGYWEMVDYSTMVKWLIANAGANSEKIAIRGFSYGGYMSCYALTYGANVFTHGMAGGSVTDWSLYDSHYTEKLMDTPEENPEGYKSASVLTYVDKFKGKLQLVHGMIDDNVHLQNSVQLLTKIQDAKKDVEFMMYSGGRHGWRNLPARQAHFDNLQTKFIYKYLLEKEVPKELLK
jgi:dipeptidyl-peptidase 4